MSLSLSHRQNKNPNFRRPEASNSAFYSLKQEFAMPLFWVAGLNIPVLGELIN